MSDSQSRPRALLLEDTPVKNVEKIIFAIDVDLSSRTATNLDISVQNQNFTMTAPEIIGWLEQIKTSILFDLMAEKQEEINEQPQPQEKEEE